jgi:hypothetical protein
MNEDAGSWNCKTGFKDVCTLRNLRHKKKFAGRITHLMDSLCKHDNAFSPFYIIGEQIAKNVLVHASSINNSLIVSFFFTLLRITYS